MKNSELKKIEFIGRIFYYHAGEYDNGHFDWEETSFYETNDKYKVVPKYFLLNFFNIITETKVVSDNKLLFKLHINIDSNCYTKSEVRKKIQRKVDLLDRAVEIKNGEII